MGKRSRKQQRLEHIHGQRGARFQRLITGLAPEQILVAPLDIHKNVHWATFHTLDGRVLEAPFALQNLRADFEAYCERLDQLISAHDIRLVLPGHEPTGIYHEAWARAFMERYAAHLAGQAHPRFYYTFLNPYQVKENRHQQFLLLRKTELIDLGAIGDLLRRGLGYPAYLPSAEDLLIRQEVRYIRGLVKEKRRHANRTLTVFDQLIPGALLHRSRFQRAHPHLTPPTPLVNTQPLERVRVQVLIQHCPNPYHILRLGRQGLIDLFHQHGERCGPKTADRILEVVQRALLPPEDVAQVLARNLQQHFQAFQTVDTFIDQAAENLAAVLPHTPARHLLALSGTSPLLVARYIACLGDVRRFLFADQIWNLAGFHPKVYISGDLVLYGALSKQGDPFLRDTLFLQAYSLAQHHPYFAKTFLTAIERGKSEVEATIHTAHQVNRVFFRLLTNDEPFHPPHITDWPAFEALWGGRMHRYFQNRKGKAQPKRRRPRKEGKSSKRRKA